MANFLRGNPLTWAYGEEVTSDQLNTIDDNIIRAPNFDDGSAHTPAANIELTGPFGLRLMGTQRLLYESREVVRTQPMVGNIGYGEDFIYNDGVRPMQNTIAVLADAVIWLSDLPHANVLNSVYVKWQGSAGHGALPATKPVVKVYRSTLNGVDTLLGTTTDAPADVTAYQAKHDIVVTSLAHTIDTATGYYFIVVLGEDDANSQTGSQIWSVAAVCTVTVQPEC